MNLINWLPSLINISKYYEDVDEFIEELYIFFKRDFIDKKNYFQDQEVLLKKHPKIDDKEATFWHLISIGPDELSRQICPERCQYLSWPSPIIAHATASCVRVWKENRSGRNTAEERIHIFLENPGYLVVLNIRKGYLLLWTAYPITREHQKKKLIKRYEYFSDQTTETVS